jgi:hypothetical protein
MIEIKSVKIKPLPSKFYETEIDVCLTEGGSEFDFTITISGYHDKPSEREYANDYHPDFGMNHVESEAHYFLAEVIRDALILEAEDINSFKGVLC